MVKATKALVLAGGLGTRLRPLTFAVPKPLITVRDRPILDYIIRQLVSYGFKELFISVNYKSSLIKLFIEDRDKYGIAISFFDEVEPLGTAGPLAAFDKRKIKLEANEPILVMNGDIITDQDFQGLVDFHQSKQADLTVGFIEYNNKLSYGVLETDADNNIKDIKEKPSFVYKASAGIYVVSQKCLSLVPNGFFTMPDLMLAALQAGFMVKAYPIEANWIAIEQLKNLEELNANETEDWISKLK